MFPTVLRTVKTSVKVAALLSLRLDGPVDGMEKESETTPGLFDSHDIAYPVAATFALLGLLFATSMLEGRAIGGDFVIGAVSLPIAIMISSISGRLTSLVPLPSSGLRVFGLSSVLLVFSILANLILPVNHIFVMMFFVSGVISAILNECNRFEESSIFFSLFIGIDISATYAAGLEISSGTTTSQIIDVQRTAIGTAFFSFWLASIALGFVVLMALRGNLQKRGSGSFFSPIPDVAESKVPLIYSSLALLSFLVPLVWLGRLEDLAEFSEGSHLGYVWGVFSAIVVTIHAFFRSEGWHVLGAVLAINWLLYTVGHLHEIGNTLPSLFSEDGFIGTFTWFFLGFWLNFFAIFFASRGVFGDIAPKRDKGLFRNWWAEHSYAVLVGMAFVTALAVRTAWNIIPAMNAQGTGLWDMTGGSDPWYMKRVVDYVIAERSHLIFDHDRAYPMGGINPRPPLFSWSLALGGLALSWLLEISAEEAVWWSVAVLPAIYGALIVFPISGISSRVHSRNAGIISAWLIALMPGHMSRSTLGMADHDSFAMLFLAIAFYFWIKALENLDHKKVFESASPNPLYVIAGMRETWRNNPKLMANATMSGIAFSVMALGWKGFVYGPGILFLAYSFQVAVNIFRGRDSLQFTSAALQMMITCIVLPAPFYAWPGMNLLLAPSGMQPMFYIIGFTFAVGWVSSSFRDKPWLLIIISGTALFGSILAILYILQAADKYNGWDILFTGGFYFSKNKIFNTIGEAQAPDRGVLFASYGPIVALIAIGCAFVLLWRGTRRNKSSMTLLGLWALIATYMAWSAGRFIMNATPVMAVSGGIGISMLWGSANFSAFSKVWRNSGIGTPRTRFRSIWPATKSRPGIPAMLMVILLISSQHATYGIDSAIPRYSEDAVDVDEDIYNIAPDILRQDFFNLFSVLNSKSYDPESSGQLWYMGTFGPSFNQQGWNEAFEWLSQQDSEVPFSERPAFVSWWDYGFQALVSGQHPTVADNFQSGIPQSGAMLLAAGQEDVLALFIATLAQGDRKQNGGELSPEFESVLLSHMSPEQASEFEAILKTNTKEFVLQRAMEVSAVYGDTELLRGHSLHSDGIPQTQESWKVFDDGEQFGETVFNESEAMGLFDEARASSSSYEIMENPEHYDFAGYRYTSDLIDDYDDVSTDLHRSNAKFAMMKAFLITAFDLPSLVSIYDGISSIEAYEVSDYGSSDTINRNHEIRYFAVDNKLYPLGGLYYGEYQNYHRGQTTGIFHAPTRLSGLDIGTYISSTYETSRNNDVARMTQSEYEEQYLSDIRDQAAGVITGSEVIQMTDIDYQHLPAFFDTMIARTYVGYGSSTLGLSGLAETPSVWLAPQYISGAPNSYLQGAMALPGAMMNHFVISNWYDETDGGHCELNSTGDKVIQSCGTWQDSNRLVKVLKYYSGATIEGTVSLDGVGAVPHARILIERDAFSGDEEPDENGSVTDRDSRTYWIPIGSTQADENGRFSFTVPAGKIKVSAFSGEPDLDAGRASIMMSGLGSSMYELWDEKSTNRNVNPVTGILGNVYGSTWLSETIVNISGDDGHSNGQSHIDASISVSPSTASGVITWSGELDFNGEPVIGATVILSPSSEEVAIAPYSAPTSDGEMEGESLEFDGIGQVVFTGPGSMVSEGVASVSGFTGTHTQSVFDNHSVTGEGQFEGRGTIVGSITDTGQIPDCTNSSVPSGSDACSIGDGSFLLNGTVNATGRFTSEGLSKFTRSLSQATFIGSGTFETDTSENLSSFGTINGTGKFSGSGIFSGPMVRPGSFHIVDALPGQYSISVDFGNGTVVDLSTPFTIPINPTPGQVPISISGGAMKGTVSLHSGRALESPIFIYPTTDSIENASSECAKTASPPCLVMPDQDGSFEVGPIVPGSYIFEVDVDDDGFPEISSTFVFESDDPLVAEFPSEVPLMTDISFTLEDSGSPVGDLDIMIRPANQTLSPVSATFDNASGSYHAELSPGNWILNHTLSEEKQIWQIIEVGVTDILDATYEFEVSQLVNGSITMPVNKANPDQSTQTIPFQDVTFKWDGFTLESTTDSEGNFSVILPRGAQVDVTVERMMGVEGFLSNGSRFLVSEGMADLDIELVDSVVVFGSVSLNRESNTYNSGYLGWEPVDVIASNNDGDISGFWREEVSPAGLFEILLPLGNWTFVLDAGELGTGPAVQKEVNTTVNVELLILPENSTVRIDLFVDDGGDNNVSNGTLVSYPFEIKPLTSNGSGYSVPIEGDEWYTDGRAEISLEPGKYRIVIDRANASAGEPFDTLYDVNEIFDVGLDSSEIVLRTVGFEPLWLVNATFRNESGDLLANHEITLHNLESGWKQTHTTDENGKFVEYMPEGEWIVIVEEFETYPDVYEGLRESISVSQESAGIIENFQTSQLATVSVYLSTEHEVESIEVMYLKFTSQEGLGYFTAEAVGFEQPVVIRTTPGLWNIEMNQTNQDGIRMLIDNTSLIESGVVVSQNLSSFQTVQRLVELSGKVFWDLNDDGSPGLNEGLANSTVSITSADQESQTESHEITSGESGEWSTFLPAMSEWTIDVEKEGYGNTSSSIVLQQNSLVHNIEIDAGEVSVSGTVSYVDENCVTNGEWETVLIPSHGISRERVIAAKQGGPSSGWTGEWSASLEPGSWVAYTSSTDSSQCKHLVSVESFIVDVDGAFLESELSIGGNLLLDTQWLDYDGEEHELSEIVDYELEINVGMGITWSEGVHLDDDGILRILLPTGNIGTSSEFILNEDGRNVSYSGGQGVSIRASQDTPITTLSIERVSKQDISISVSPSEIIQVDLLDIDCESDCEYESAQFTLSVTYEGHNPFDTYDVTATVPGMDGMNWKVEFQNDSGDWLESTSFAMGLDNVTNTDITLRVVPANRSVAHHFPNGHSILVKFATQQGYSVQSEMNVQIPRYSGFELGENFEETIFFQSEQKLLTIEIPYANLGNSDEILSFQFVPPDGWDVSGPMSQPVAPFSFGTSTITLTHTSSDDFADGYSENMEFKVVDSVNFSYDFQISLVLDSPSLSLEGSTISLLGGGSSARYGFMETYVVTVSNSGNVDATGVTLLAKLCSDIQDNDEDGNCDKFEGVNSSAVNDVPRMGQATFYINMDFTQYDGSEIFYIQFEIADAEKSGKLRSCNDDSVEKTFCVREAQLGSSSDENSNLQYMWLVLAAMLVLLLLYLTRRPGRRTSAPF